MEYKVGSLWQWGPDAFVDGGVRKNYYSMGYWLLVEPIGINGKILLKKVWDEDKNAARVDFTWETRIGTELLLISE